MTRPATRENSEDREVSDYVETLRRVCQSLNSGIDLTSVLQAIVEALCDHTAWQLCFIYVMDTDGGFGEIAARRDRVDYTAESPQQRWEFSGNPALDAHRRNEVIAVSDIATAAEYPQLQQSAAAKGIVSAAYVPLSSNDPLGRPMVLCVQSTLRVLDDSSQIPFLRAVASLASLAATNARLLGEARETAAHASDSAALLSSVIDGVTRSLSSAQLLREVESRTGQSLIVLNSEGRPTYVGHAPAPETMTGPSWADAVTAAGAAIHHAVDVAFAEAGTPTVMVDLAVGGTIPGLSAVASRLGADPSASTVLVVSAGKGRERTASVSTATAIVLLRDRLRMEAQTTLQRDVVLQLLEGKVVDDYEFAGRAAFVGISLAAPKVLVVVWSHSETTERVGGVMRAHVRRWNDVHLEYVDGYFVLLMPYDGRQRSSVTGILSALAGAITQPDGRPAVTVTCSQPCDKASQYAAAWHECVQALRLAEQVQRTGVVDIHEFGAYRLLLPALEGRDLDQFIRSTIGPIVDNDAEHQGALFATLESFTTFGGRFQQTARTLNIHVSTLRYRLHRIETLLGRDLSDNETRFDLMLAARLERLRRGRVG